MSRYRKIEIKIWGDEKFQLLTPLQPSGQALWFYLLTSPHTGPIPGLFRASRAGMADDLGWPLDDFDSAFLEVTTNGMAKADWHAKLIHIPKAILYDKPAAPNVVKSWVSEWESLPECGLKTEAWQSLYDAMALFSQDKTDYNSYLATFLATCQKTPSKTWRVTQPPTPPPTPEVTQRPPSPNQSLSLSLSLSPSLSLAAAKRAQENYAPSPNLGSAEPTSAAAKGRPPAAMPRGQEKPEPEPDPIPTSRETALEMLRVAGYKGDVKPTPLLEAMIESGDRRALTLAAIEVGVRRGDRDWTNPDAYLATALDAMRRADGARKRGNGAAAKPEEPVRPVSELQARWDAMKAHLAECMATDRLPWVQDCRRMLCEWRLGRPWLTQYGREPTPPDWPTEELHAGNVVIPKRLRDEEGFDDELRDLRPELSIKRPAPDRAAMRRAGRRMFRGDDDDDMVVATA